MARRRGARRSRGCPGAAVGRRTALAALASWTVSIGIGSCGGDAGPDRYWGKTVDVGEGIRLHEPLGELELLPDYFAWRTATAASYAVALFDSSGTRIWMTESVPVPSLKVDASLRGMVRPGERYGWQVLAVEGSGRVIDGSPVGTFMIRGLD